MFLIFAKQRLDYSSTSNFVATQFKDYETDRCLPKFYRTRNWPLSLELSKPPNRPGAKCHLVASLTNSLWAKRPRDFLLVPAKKLTLPQAINSEPEAGEKLDVAVRM